MTKILRIKLRKPTEVQSKKSTALSESRSYIGDEVSRALAGAKEIDVAFDRLLLDPNNPRIRREGDVYVDGMGRNGAAKLDDSLVQESAEARMDDRNGRSLAAYYQKLRAEGFLGSLAKIHVAGYADNYVLCDGNTRVAAIRRLLRDHASKKIEMAPRVLESFKKIPVVLLGTYGTKDTMLAWNAVRANMHILSPKSWGPLQKAEFIYGLNDDGMPVRDIMALVGGQSKTVRQMIEAFRMYKIIRKTEYGPRIIPSRFNLMMEVVSKKKLTRYLEWTGRAANPTKLRVFCELMAPNDGSRGYLSSASQLARLRALGDNPNHWNAALDPKKNKKYLSRIESFDSGREINELAVDLWGKLKKATPDEIEQSDPKILSDIAAACGKVLDVRARLVIN